MERYIDEITNVINVIRALDLINSRKLTLCPNFFEIPTVTILADAPSIVRFPPKQAPRTNAHQRILFGMGFDCCMKLTIGIMAMVKGILSKKPEAIPDTHNTISTMR